MSGQGFGFEIASRDDADLAHRVMEFAAANQTSPTRRCERDALHMSLSRHPTELPTRDQMEEAARDALKAVGMENACALFVAHNDTEHAHLHIVASRINLISHSKRHANEPHVSSLPLRLRVNDAAASHLLEKRFLAETSKTAKRD
jgi:hypothetical protein